MPRTAMATKASRCAWYVYTACPSVQANLSASARSNFHPVPSFMPS